MDELIEVSVEGSFKRRNLKINILFDTEDSIEINCSNFNDNVINLKQLYLYTNNRLVKDGIIVLGDIREDDIIQSLPESVYYLEITIRDNNFEIDVVEIYDYHYNKFGMISIDTKRYTLEKDQIDKIINDLLTIQEAIEKGDL